jgi:ribosomal-protein-alanine N-acetyltransferase
MAASPLGIDLARRDDLAAMAQMSRDYVESGLGWSYRPEKLARMHADADTVALVARAGSTLAGFAVMTFGDTRAHLVLLAVAPSLRRRRVAQRLVAWLVDSALTAGIAAIDVELRAGNGPARALYASLGFAAAGSVVGYYRGRENALRMRRVLSVPAAAGLLPRSIGQP